MKNRGSPLHRLGHWPAASWLAVLAAAVSIILTVRTGSGLSFSSFFGAVLVFATPYLVIAIALGGRSVWSKGLGVALAALMAWLTSSGVTEFIASVQHSNPVRPMAMTFVVLTVVGVAVSGFGARNLFQAAHATGYWAQTPIASRLAFAALAYWTMIFVADTYLSANLPLTRMLLEPTLMVISLASALMLRAPKSAPQTVGVLLAIGAGVATIVYWATHSQYLTLTGGSPTVPDLAYFTLLPWPLLLGTSLILDVAIAMTGILCLARRQPDAGRAADC